MSKSKPYSTRLSYQEKRDEDAMRILDELDPEGKPDAYKATHWIRDAVLLRMELQQKLMEMTGQQADPEVQHIQVMKWVDSLLLELATRPAQVEGGLALDELLDPSDELENQIHGYLSQMEEGQMRTYLSDALKMRYMLEKNAPAFFMSRYTGQQPQSNVLEAMPGIEDPSIPIVDPAGNEMAAATDSTAGVVKLLPPYLVRLQRSIPDFISAPVRFGLEA
jgi:hypothetical protein